MGFNYVVLKVAVSGDLHKDVPIIYPDFLVHSEVAEALKSIEILNDAEVVSAGNLLLDAVSCSGKSTTLEIDSRGEEDTALINQYPYFHGLS